MKSDYPVLPKDLFKIFKADGVYEVLVDRHIQNHHAQTDSLDNAGFYASFYVKKQHNKITDAVIAIRGADNFLNDEVDIESWWCAVMVGGHASLPKQYNGMALSFYHKSRWFCKDHNIPLAIEVAKKVA